MPAVAEPDALADALKTAGLEPVSLSAGDLADPAKLDVKKMPLLVLPYGGAYPAAGLEALDRYLRAGGGLIAFGAERFTDPLFQVDGRWFSLSSGKSQGARTLAPTWDLKNHGSGAPLKASGDGSANNPFRFDADEVKSSMYAGTKPGPLPEPGALIIFEARGDQRTPLLCLELQEADGSRWKQIISLSPSWREYRVHTATFSSYATPSRTNDYFRGAKAKMLYFGLIRQMAGAGPHRFELRNLKIQEADVPSKLVFDAGIPIAGRDQVRKYFGRQHVPALPTKPWPEYFAEGVPFEGGRLMPAGDHPLISGFAPDSFSSPTDGRLLVQKPSARLDSAGEPILLFPERTAAPRVIGLLEATDALRKKLGLAAALIIHQSGPYAGGRWAILSLNRLDAAARGGKATLEVFGRVARYIASGVVIEQGSPAFSMREGRGRVDFAQPLRNRSQAALDLKIECSLAQSNVPVVKATKTLDLRPFQSAATTWHTAPLDALNWRSYGAATEISVGEVLLDRVTYRVDAREALHDLCEFLVARAGKANGKFSGTHYFVDHRGARTLLAAYEIFGNERYRDTAIGWAKVMVEEQRTDGGYRMGYGIGTRGESCFVADGGEIALGVARAACYATGEERRRLLESVRAYMGFRDSFRVNGGGIGVGWSATDFSKRPTVRLEKPEKIFAPELNTYTIGCTLGAAYVWATLTGRPEDLQSARTDADWFLARSKSASGATAESFVLAHHLETDPAQSRRYEEYLRERFVKPMAESKAAWWLLRGGRASLDTHAMSYCVKQLAPDPRLECQMARATSAMYAKESPTSVYRLYEKPALNHDEWIYLCFGGVGLAETVEPMVTLKRIKADR